MAVNLLKGSPVREMAQKFDGMAIISKPVEVVPGIIRDSNEATESYRLTVKVGVDAFTLTDWGLSKVGSDVAVRNMNDLACQLNLNDLTKLLSDEIVGKSIHIQCVEKPDDATGVIFYNHNYRPARTALEAKPEAKAKGKAKPVREV